MNLQLSDKTALVSGSTAGIGLAIARALAAEGARVIVNGRTEARVTAAIASIRAAAPAAKLEALPVDLATADGVAEAARLFPTIDVLVNNLGVYGPKSFEEITDADWTSIIETNFLGGVRLTRRYLPGMRAANWGRVLFVSSESGVNIPVEMIHYGVTKTMQLALARGLAESCAGTGITVNSILPGPTRSEGVEQFIADLAAKKGVTPAQIEEDFFQAARPSSLLRRFATTDEVASMAAYLASPLAAATNGAALRVEGGVIRSIF